MNTQPITQPINQGRKARLERRAHLAFARQTALREAELRVCLENLQAEDNRDHDAIRRVQVELSVITSRKALI